MKNKLWLIAVVTAILFCFIACDDGTGGGGGTVYTFDSISGFAAWLAAQPANTPATAYNVKLNVNSFGGSSAIAGSAGKALRENSTKYVSLVLSGSALTSIEQSAFENCASLTGVTIPASVTNIAYAVFNYCSSLTAINVDAANTAYASQDGVLYNKTKTRLITYPAGKAGAFTIPSGVTSTEQHAFGGCTGLTGVTIPSSVTSIGSQAFYGCTSLTAINVDAANTAYASQDGVLYNKTKTYLITYPAGKAGTTFTIPSGVTIIESDAFIFCTSLTGITIPSGVTNIGGQAFLGCTGLTGVTIPSSVTNIGSQAFSGCNSLTSVTFQGTIASSEFNSNAFSGLGDLRAKFYATDTTNGTPGTYTRPNGSSTTWTKSS